MADVVEQFAATGSGTPVLAALRSVLDGADEAIVCSAFIDRQGVELIAREARHLGSNLRIVATTVFRGASALGALDAAAGLGARCRVRNLPKGTFHPKVVVAKHRTSNVAMVGSANLTRGLIANDEAAVVLRGDLTAVAAATTRWWGEAVDLSAVSAPREQDLIDAGLWSLLSAAVKPGDVVHTLGRSPKPNRLVSVTPAGLLVETERSASRRSGPQPLEPYMLNTAWDAIKAAGSLTNRHLLDDLRVHRSSAVCAVLAVLPVVAVTSTRPIRLELVEPVAAYGTQLAEMPSRERLASEGPSDFA